MLDLLTPPFEQTASEAVPVLSAETSGGDVEKEFALALQALIQGVKISEFARRVDISRTYASQLRNGHAIASDELIRKMCQEFNAEAKLSSLLALADQERRTRMYTKASESPARQYVNRRLSNLRRIERTRGEQTKQVLLFPRGMIRQTRPVFHFRYELGEYSLDQWRMTLVDEIGEILFQQELKDFTPLEGGRAEFRWVCPEELQRGMQYLWQVQLRLKASDGSEEQRVLEQTMFEIIPAEMETEIGWIEKEYREKLVVEFLKRDLIVDAIEEAQRIEALEQKLRTLTGKEASPVEESLVERLKELAASYR